MAVSVPSVHSLPGTWTLDLVGELGAAVSSDLRYCRVSRCTDTCNAQTLKMRASPIPSMVLGHFHTP